MNLIQNAIHLDPIWIKFGFQHGAQCGFNVEFILEPILDSDPDSGSIRDSNMDPIPIRFGSKWVPISGSNWDQDWIPIWIPICIQFGFIWVSNTDPIFEKFWISIMDSIPSESGYELGFDRD